MAREQAKEKGRDAMMGDEEKWESKREDEKRALLLRFLWIVEKKTRLL